MHGRHETSLAPRLTATAVNVASVVGAVWLLLRDGDASARDVVLLGCSGLYVARTTFAMFVLLKRRFDWGEALIVAGLFGAIHLLFAWLGSDAPTSLSALDVGALVAYAVGSWLHTGSEYGRYKFKRNGANKGRLYTQGLFGWSMHINYFGDSLLFTGFALLTGSPWALLVPAGMTASFVGQHIPSLDAYLRERYGDEFAAYERRTKKFIPYLY